ncbi:hypothetical protein GLOIN_2v1815132 [Rhizophagus irregularis DAOM 181602=DAOM 197198]|nr:hypothetical protein GLOIN_2v1815132 [Rhizophagus irregularis DAOM 181602=DAOM 197198]
MQKIGQMNSATAILGLYRKDDVTPYMHMLTMHVPYFMCRLKKKGLLLRLFSTSSIEKKNHDQVRLFFRGTTMGGDLRAENENLIILLELFPNGVFNLILEWILSRLKQFRSGFSSGFLEWP